MFRFCDSFDHYLDITKKWTAIINAGGGTVAAGRNGRGFQFARSGIGFMPIISKTLDPQTLWVTGFAAYNNAGLGTPNGSLVQLYDNNQLIGTVSQEADGTLTSHYGNDFTAKDSHNYSFTPLKQATWYYIEVKFEMSDGVKITIRVNGKELGSNSGPINGYNTDLSFNPGRPNRLAYSGTGATYTIIDDLYICDNQPGSLTDFIGDVGIGCIYPKEDVIDQFLPSKDNFSLVNEHTPDDDSSYVYSNAPGSEDSYLFDEIATFSGTIPAVHLNIYARKDDEGYRAFSPIGITGDPVFINDSFTYYSFPDDTPRSPASVNTTAFGYKIKVL